MGEQNNFYKQFEHKSRSAVRFGKSVLIPFVCGILGAVLVLGISFGVPDIRNKLIGQNNEAGSELTLPASSSSSGNLQQVSLTNYSDTAEYAANKVLPSIVGITVEYNVTTRSPFGLGAQSGTEEAKGSGIIMSSDGYILTNNHVVNDSSTDSSNSSYTISGAASITVSLYNDSNSYPATVVGLDPTTDLAVIKIDKTGLTAADIGDSSSVKIGEFVLAIGNPLGLDSTVTSGIVSAVNRSVPMDDGTNYNLIQTDAAINAGNSGGALINSEGKVIGINTLKMSGTGIEGMGFSIPINDTIDIYNQLKQNGKVSRPYVGISGVSVTADLAKQYNLPVGIYVQSVDTGSGAADAKIQVGDVITTVDGTSVQSINDLNNIKNNKKIGDTIKITLTRDGKSMDVTVTLKEQP